MSSGFHNFAQCEGPTNQELGYNANEVNTRMEELLVEARRLDFAIRVVEMSAPTTY
jgi:hypothetical protein